MLSTHASDAYDCWNTYAMLAPPPVLRVCQEKNTRKFLMKLRTSAAHHHRPRFQVDAQLVLSYNSDNSNDHMNEWGRCSLFGFVEQKRIRKIGSNYVKWLLLQLRDRHACIIHNQPLRTICCYFIASPFDWFVPIENWGKNERWIDAKIPAALILTAHANGIRDEWWWSTSTAASQHTWDETPSLPDITKQGAPWKKNMFLINRHEKKIAGWLACC